MKPTHVLLSGGPGLVREIVAQIVVSQQDMTLVETSGGMAHGALQPRADVDVVVLLLDPGSRGQDVMPSPDAAAGPDASDQDAELRHDAALRHIFPACAVVVVDNRGTGAWTYEPEIRRTAEVVGELTPEAVAGAIRSAARRKALRRTVIAPGAAS